MVLSVILVLVVAVISLIVSGKITKPIEELELLMSKASKGDLNVESSYKSKNEIGRLSTGFNKMIRDFHELISETQTASHEVRDYSNRMNSAMGGETETVVNHISKSIDEVSQAALQQAKGAEQGLEESLQLSEELDVMAKNIDSSISASDTIMKMSGDGTSSMEMLSSKNVETVEMSEQVFEAVSSLNSKTNEIITVVDAISGISEQTNLLALNASIEAARQVNMAEGLLLLLKRLENLLKAQVTRLKT